jgi:GTP-binding protein EngB required for normal cell division
MKPGDSSTRLNPAQALHLQTSAQYADELFGKIESILFTSKSKSPFHKYKDTLTPAQIKVVEDYLAQIRAQLVRVLAAQGIPLPKPEIESVHAIRTTLAFAMIAFQDCTPRRMKGYGDLPESKVRELNGLVNEMIGALDKLDGYLAQGLGQDLQGRLQRLEQSGGDVTTLKTLERIINDHGLVEFRATLTMILERLESPKFEIALFGRVSSGKSSLLNAIVKTEILPVGVNPITAVPTRLVYGESPRLNVWYADRNPDHLAPDELAAFVTEEQNPANCKHVTRVVVELPSARLRDGVVLVDTPGLGSLATSGAAETLAYLPRCDLGLVLIDAASTLADDDLSTIRLLYEAGVPVSVLLSKSDLLTEADRDRALAYISRHIAAQLGIDLTPYPVSARPTHQALLDTWLERDIFPLYERHQQLTQQSLRRKTGALRDAVESALRVHLQRAERQPVSNAMDFSAIEARLRNAVGRFAETRKICSDVAHEIENLADRGLTIAASHLATKWSQHDGASAAEVVRDALVDLAAAQASLVAGTLTDLARELTRVLQDTGRDLGFSPNGNEEDLTSVLIEMPRLDVPLWTDDVSPSFRLKLSARMEARRIQRKLAAQIGATVTNAFYNFGKLLWTWAQRALNDLQLRFDAEADKYRAHMIRLGDSRKISQDEQFSIRRDLDQLIHAESVTSQDLPPAP